MSACCPNEAWIAVVDDPRYEVSSCGRVRSWIHPGAQKPRLTPLILRQSKHPSGSGMVSIGGRTRRVRVMVAAAFLGSVANRYTWPIDGDHANAHVENIGVTIKPERES